jgi:hypothetical protein
MPGSGTPASAPNTAVTLIASPSGLIAGGFTGADISAPTAVENREVRGLGKRKRA